MKKSQIFLPADDEGNPDWEFMENYTKKIHDDMLNSIKNKVNELLD